MVALPDVRAVVKALKEAIDDFNSWPSSESDSPLRIAARKGALDDKAILSIDAGLRRKANSEVAGYKVPSDRTINRYSFQEKVWPIVQQAFTQLPRTVSIESRIELERATEACEFLIQAYNQFAACGNPTYIEVTSPTESTVGMIVGGEADRLGESYMAIASTLLVRT